MNKEKRWAFGDGVNGEELEWLLEGLGASALAHLGSESFKSD